MENKSKRFNRILTLLILAIMFFTTLPQMTAKATAVAYPFDKTNVLDDLESSEDFNLTEYYIDKTLKFKSPGIINFVEWCYSAREDQSDFALYVYFYNPEASAIDTESVSNRIQMATVYDKGKAYENASPTDFNTFPLIFCNKSTRAGYEGLFYKFRIHLNETAKRLVLLNVDLAERRYDVSGITLVVDGVSKEYPVGGTFRFKGYSKGYGADETAESTLENLEFLPIETIQLEVNSTTYSNLVNVNAENTVSEYNDVTSVYFSVPEKYIYDSNGNEIANLQRVKCEWYEYKTEPIVVVNNNDAFDAFKPYRGVSVENGYDASRANGYGFGVGLNYEKDTNGSDYHYYWKAHFNKASTYTVERIAKEEYLVNPLTWLFYKESGNVSNVLVSRGELEQYAESYTDSAHKGYISIGSNNISLDLFQDTVDEGRTRGYNVREFDNTADRFNILDTTVTENKFLFWKTYGIESEVREGLAPIEMIENDLLSLNDSTLSYTYLVNDKDVSDFRLWATAEKLDGNVPYIFHFAQTESTLMSGDIVKNSKDVGNAQANVMTVFLDFKIITLTFKQGEDFKVIPVTQDPIDIYKDVNKDEFGKYDKDGVFFWQQLLSILVLALLIVVELLLCSAGAKVIRACGRIKPDWLKIVVQIIAIILSISIDALICYYGIDLIKSFGWLFQ